MELAVRVIMMAWKVYLELVAYNATDLMRKWIKLILSALAEMAGDSEYKNWDFISYCHIGDILVEL